MTRFCFNSQLSQNQKFLSLFFAYKAHRNLQDFNIWLDIIICYLHLSTIFHASHDLPLNFDKVRREKSHSSEVKKVRMIKMEKALIWCCGCEYWSWGEVKNMIFIGAFSASHTLTAQPSKHIWSDFRFIAETRKGEKSNNA